MQDPQQDRSWYMPHYHVENINKPGKIRRVANAASKFRGHSLNSNFFTGPDLLNNLLGVLMRFREHPVAVLADIVGMFMQITIHQIDQSAHRFLWKNFVKLVERQDPQPDRIWYLPHHPVENIIKPGKVRRFANAASKFRGQSLNSNLLTGPDLLNNLLGVPMRF